MERDFEFYRGNKGGERHSRLGIERMECAALNTFRGWYWYFELKGNQSRQHFPKMRGIILHYGSNNEERERKTEGRNSDHVAIKNLSRVARKKEIYISRSRERHQNSHRTRSKFNYDRDLAPIIVPF